MHPAGLHPAQYGSQWTGFCRTGPCRRRMYKGGRWWGGLVSVVVVGPAEREQPANEEPSEASIHLEHGPLQLPWPWLWSIKMLDPRHSHRANTPLSTTIWTGRMCIHVCTRTDLYACTLMIKYMHQCICFPRFERPGFFLLEWGHNPHVWNKFPLRRISISILYHQQRVCCVSISSLDFSVLSMT